MTNNQDELIARLTRFYKETGSEVSGAPPAWVVPGKRRTFGWLQPALATIVLVALAVGLAVTFRLVREEAHRRIGPFPIPSASPSPTPSATATPVSSWVTRRVPIGSVVAMSLDSSAVFVLYDPGPMNGRPDPARTMLARIDRATAAVTTAGPFANATLLAQVAPGLWIGAGADQATAASDTQWLTLVDPVTLSVKHRVHLPGRPVSGTFSLPQIAGTSDLLWLGYGNSLYRLDPASGLVLLTQGLQGTVTSLSIEPVGRRLYVGVDAPPGPNSPALVIERDPMTGGLVASAPTGGAGLGGPQVAAAPDGVWIAYGTGMMGAVEHRRATDLSVLVGPKTGHTNGIRVFVSGGALWLVDGGAGRLACADFRTGSIVASSQETLPAAIVADANGSYLGDADGVGFLRPDPSCPH